MRISDTVWKFPIMSLDDSVELTMPKNAQVLDVQMQRGVMTLWAVVTPTNEPEKRRFRIAGTGHPLLPSWHAYRYHATVQDGEFVWHVFEDMSS